MNITYTIHGKILKSHTITIHLKYQIQSEMKSLNFRRDHILYQIFKLILSTLKKKLGEMKDNPSISIYVNKI